MRDRKSFVHILPSEDGELLASWLLRICSRQTVTYRRFSTNNLSSSRWGPALDAFPNLQDLYSLGAARRENERELICHHTLLELLHPYYSETEWQQLVDSLKRNATAVPRSKMRSRKNFIRVCPRCHSEGAMRGTIIWHRNHQISASTSRSSSTDLTMAT